MTIQISIENKDAARTVEIVETTRSRGGSEVGQNVHRLEPGERRSYYIHLLKDLVVREQTPA